MSGQPSLVPKPVATTKEAKEQLAKDASALQESDARVKLPRKGNSTLDLTGAAISQPLQGIGFFGACAGNLQRHLLEVLVPDSDARAPRMHSYDDSVRSYTVL